MKSRYWSLVMVLVLLMVTLLPSFAFANEEITITVNDTVIRPDVPAQIIYGRTMVPIRFVAQAMDCTVDWDQPTLSVLIASDGHYEGSPPPNNTGYIRIYVNGNILYPDVTPQLINGRTMVPVRFIAEALGANVGWDEQSQTVIITDTAPVTSNVNEYYQNSFVFLQNIVNGYFDKALEITTDDFKNKVGSTELSEFRAFILMNGEGQLVSKSLVDKGGGVVETIGVLKFAKGNAIAVHLTFKDGKIDNLVGR